jgi:uncharacterized membrane protein
MTLYHILLFFHITAAVIWIGAGVTLEILGWRAARGHRPEQRNELIAISEWFAPRIFMPAALLTLLFGILMVSFGRPTFSQFWVVFALIGFLLTAFIGGAFVGRLSKQTSELIKKKKKEKLIDQLYQKVVLASRIDFALLFIILFDMVIKPTVTSTSFFIISFLFFVVIVGFSWSQYRHNLAS